MFYSSLQDVSIIKANSREEYIKKIESNYRELEKVKNNKIDEIITTLDLFEGRLSLLDVLNTPIYLLNQLINRKQQQIEKHNEIIAKNRKAAEERRLERNKIVKSKNKKPRNKK